MAMKDVDSRFAVLKAMAEYRDLGQNPFLLKYGFGKAKEYRILFEGIEYDSKAIVGVAHKYQFGKPLTSKEFNGGEKTVVPLLRKIGFNFSTDMMSDIFNNSGEIEPAEKLTEGLARTILVNAYERSSEARRRCIEKYGAICCVCKFDFGKTYGKLAKGYIHVHHLRPLSEIRAEYVIDPVADLRPVCPNCHAVLHLGRSRSIEDVQSMIASQK